MGSQSLRQSDASLHRDADYSMAKQEDQTIFQSTLVPNAAPRGGVAVLEETLVLIFRQKECVRLKPADLVNEVEDGR